MKIEEYTALKRKVTSAQYKVSETKGALKQLDERLKEMGCSSIKQAKAKLADLKKEAALIEKGIVSKKKEFEKKYADFL